MRRDGGNSRRSSILLACLLTTGILACASPPVRFDGGAPVTEIVDRKNVEEPIETEFYRQTHHLNNFIDRQIRVGLDPLPPLASKDVNRYGEVPNSTWYENRSDRITPESVGQGAGGDDPGPESYLPWTIVRMKSGGRNPGFIFEDSRGVGYICKFDKPGEPVIATGAGAVSVRLFWALGYHVPDDRIVQFDRDELMIGEGAVKKLSDGKKVPIEKQDIDRMLSATATRLDDGSYRALVSRFLPGRPVGGYSYRGTREEDPNDRVPHQDRRSLRALRVFGAWLNHGDQKIDNTLDLYVEENGINFIRHYMVDFDGCLGGYWAARHEERIGFAYELDMGEMISGIPALGLIRRPYENMGAPVHPEIGLFESDRFDPESWKPNYFNDQLTSLKAADTYWAGTILAGIDSSHIREAVKAARFSDQDAETILANILEERRIKTVDWALRQVTPVFNLDRLKQSGMELRILAGDGLVDAGLQSDLQYIVEYLDGNGQSIERRKAPASSPETAIAIDRLSGLEYLIVRWTARDQNGRKLPPTEAHYIMDQADWRLAGILRDGE